MVMTPSASLVAQMAIVTLEFCRHNEVGPAALSQRILGDTRFLPEAIKAARAREIFHFHSRRYDMAMMRLSALWPADLAWPETVNRPAGTIPDEIEREVRGWIAKRRSARA